MVKLNLRYGIVMATLMISELAISHAGHPNDIAWLACEEKLINDSCSFKNTRKDLYIGSCKLMSSSLMCVRNQPIQKFSATLDSVD